MATSTFGKQFTVRPETPTLRKDFHSNLAHLTQEKDLKSGILKALNR